jgi:hypothetical protein
MKRTEVFRSPTGGYVVVGVLTHEQWLHMLDSLLRRGYVYTDDEGLVVGADGAVST